MTQAIQMGSVLAAVLLFAALLVVWSRKTTWLRAAAIPLALLATGAASAITLYTLGFAVPLIGGLTAPAGDAPVLSSKFVMHDGIYLTLDLPAGPRLFWLPWNTKLAEKLQEMEGDPGNAGVVATIPPFEFSWDRQRPPSFQPIPQPKFLPDKPPEPPKAPSFAA